MAQDLILEIPGGDQDFQFTGRFILPIGDLDGDGFDDFYASSGGFLNERLTAYSGKNGAQIQVLNLAFQWANGFDEWFTVADRDGDGLRELVAHSPTMGFEGPGGVVVFSSADGSKIRETYGKPFSDALGTAACEVDDITGDGITEILATDPFSQDPDDPGSQFFAGRMHMLDGATGVELFRWYAPSQGSPLFSSGVGMGAECFAIGDQDGDGVSDVLVSPEFTSTTTANNELIASFSQIFSGLDGALIGSVPNVIAGGATFSESELSAAAIGDLDGDGLCEFAVGRPFAIVDHSASGSVMLHRGGTAEILNVWSGQKEKEALGANIRRLEDWDGDGYDDILASAGRPGIVLATEPEGLVRGYSSGSYDELFEILPPVKPNFLQRDFGTGIGLLEDVNGDGLPELAVGAPRFVSSAGGATYNPGRAYIYSLADLELTGQPWFLKVEPGGFQVLNLDFGPDFAGSFYMVLGSFTGIDPAVPIDGLLLPLVPDSYTLLPLQAGGGPLLGPDFLGTLNGLGRAQLTVNLPPGSSAAGGLIVWHAALVFGPLGNVVKTSNAVALTLVP